MDFVVAGICGHFNAVARENAAKWGRTIPEEYRLDYLPTDTDEGRQYLDWMGLAMDYAYENRTKMMEAAKNAVKAKVEKFTDYRAA
ncbi:MAG: RtcB family protein [Lachnospiraceae bacterium]|nr:RtcB family protein [Lachnospiraceae bacterium]